MKKLKVSSLEGPALDWEVAKAEETKVRWSAPHETLLLVGYAYLPYTPSTNWSQGGPIIDREGISPIFVSGDLGEPRSYWVAAVGQQSWQYCYGPYHEQDDERSLQIAKSECHSGPTALVAAMRCYVASKLGDEIEIPEELYQ